MVDVHKLIITYLIFMICYHIHCTCSVATVHTAAYMEDNKKVYLKLKEYLVETDGWAWIKTFDRSQDGQAAYQSWVNHYNGASKLDRCTQMAKVELDSLFYKN